MIELLVAFILLASAMAVAGSVLITGASSTATATTERKARQMLSDAIASLEDDLYPSRARHRSNMFITDLDLYREHILNNDPLPNPFSPGSQLDVQDINVATANELVFQSDVLNATTTPLPECVRYLAAVSGTKWTLTRSVHPWSYHCGNGALGAALESRVLARTNATLAPTSVFRYERYRNAFPAALNPDPKNCVSLPASSNLASARDRNSVMSITVDMSSLAYRGESTSSKSLRQSVAMRSRRTYDYRYGLGCA